MLSYESTIKIDEKNESRKKREEKVSEQASVYVCVCVVSESAIE